MQRMERDLYPAVHPCQDRAAILRAACSQWLLRPSALDQMRHQPQQPGLSRSFLVPLGSENGLAKQPVLGAHQSRFLAASPEAA